MARNSNALSIAAISCAAGLVAYACATAEPSHFRGGGDPDLTPEGGGTYSSDTGPEDTSDTGFGDTGMDTGGDTEDTAAPYEGTGYSTGDVAYNLVAPDQDGQEWRLYQHDGSPIVLTLGYGLGDDFIQVCSFLPDVVSSFESYDVQGVAVLLLDATGTVAEQEDAAEWADLYELDTVLYDEDGSIALDWTGSSTRTRTYVISADMVIEYANYDYTYQAQVESTLEDLLY